MKSYVYIIQTVDNTLYCGFCLDVKKRYLEHSNKNSKKGAKYTKAHPPSKIVFLKAFEEKSLAYREEYRIKKTLSRAQKLALIEENKKETAFLLKENDLAFD